MHQSAHPSDVERLAAMHGVSLSIIARLLEQEHAQLTQNARITTFIPVLARRRVEAALRAAAPPERAATDAANKRN